MTKVLSVHGGPHVLRRLREACRMEPPEFADALGRELGWEIPVAVLAVWEKGERRIPAPVVLAARRLAAAIAPLSATTVGLNRREFLQGTSAAAGLAVVGLSAGAVEPVSRSVSGPVELGRPVEDPAVTVIEGLVAEYRRLYGHTSAAELNTRASGLVHVLLDMETASQAPGVRPRLTSVLGQAALLAGLTSLMGAGDLASARSYYGLALRAANDAADRDLAVYVSGSLGFADDRSGRLDDAVERVEATRELVDEDVTPMTRAWLAALASELHAKAGHELSCRRSLDDAATVLDRYCEEEPVWKAPGTFDRSKLVAYEGADLALQGEVDEACRRACEALDLAAQLGHSESVARVRRVHRRLQEHRGHPPVRDLGDRLLLAM